MATTTGSVTVLVSRHVRAGHAAEFERLAEGLIEAAGGFDGHLGGYLIRPEAEGEPWHTLFAFDTAAHLAAWTGSAERRAWLDRIAAISESVGDMRVLSGLETWFSLPGARARKPPPRWKMALTTWAGIFPLVLALSALVAPLLQPVHPVLSVAVVTALVTIAMTWLVMPALTRALAGWLYPEN